MFKKIVLIILINSMLIVGCLGCGSVSSDVTEPNTKFSAYSDDKAFYVYGEISSNELKKDKPFTVNAHLKNMTDYAYNLSSDGPIIDMDFEKFNAKVIYAGCGEYQKIDANGIINVKISFTPKETGKYILSIKSIFSTYNVSTKKLKEYKILFNDRHFEIN